MIAYAAEFEPRMPISHVLSFFQDLVEVRTG
jgi:hypothetical protein